MIVRVQSYGFTRSRRPIRVKGGDFDDILIYTIRQRMIVKHHHSLKTDRIVITYQLDHRRRDSGQKPVNMRPYFCVSGCGTRQCGGIRTILPVSDVADRRSGEATGKSDVFFFQWVPAAVG